MHLYNTVPVNWEPNSIFRSPQTSQFNNTQQRPTFTQQRQFPPRPVIQPSNFRPQQRPFYNSFASNQNSQNTYKPTPMDTSSGNTRRTQRPIFNNQQRRPNFVSEELFCQETEPSQNFDEYQNSNSETKEIQNYLSWDPEEDEKAERVRLATIDTEEAEFPPRPIQLPEQAQVPLYECQYNLLWRVHENNDNRNYREYHQNFIREPSIRLPR